MANKKGMSLNKIMDKYQMNNIPSFETSNKFLPKYFINVLNFFYFMKIFKFN